MKRTISLGAALLAVTAFGGTAALAETGESENPMAEAQAFLASPTSLAQGIATAETAAAGKVAAIEYQNGENGATDLIVADVILADGTEKTVAINPADGKVMNVTLASNDEQHGEEGEGGAGEQDGENASN